MKSQLYTLHILKEAKSQARRELLSSTSDEFECAINTLNGNHKLSEEEKGKLSKYKNRLEALVNPKISFKNKRKHLIQRG